MPSLWSAYRMRSCGRYCFARLPDGQIGERALLKINRLSRPPWKNISVFPKCKSGVCLPPSRLVQRGVAQRQPALRRDAVDGGGAADERAACGRQSRVVLTPRRWRQACGSIPQATVARKPGHRGERGISRKTTAQGMPGCSGEPVVTTLVCFSLSHARLRVQRAPGIPRALCF